MTSLPLPFGYCPVDRLILWNLGFFRFFSQSFSLTMIRKADRVAEERYKMRDGWDERPLRGRLSWTFYWMFLINFIYGWFWFQKLNLFFAVMFWRFFSNYSETMNFKKLLLFEKNSFRIALSFRLDKTLWHRQRSGHVYLPKFWPGNSYTYSNVIVNAPKRFGGSLGLFGQ